MQLVSVHSACRYAVFLNNEKGYSVIAVHAIALSDKHEVYYLGSLVRHDGSYREPEFYHSKHTLSMAPTHDRAFSMAREATAADSKGDDQ